MKVQQLSDELGVAFGTSGVRGLVKDLTPALCFAFVRSFLQTVCHTANRVAIGIDLRPSSPDIAKACILAAEPYGVEVVYCGDLPTPALAFYAMQNSMPAVMITGSHIPFDRNGIKFYRPDGEISKMDEAAILEGNVEIPESIADQVAYFTLPKINTSAMALFKQRYTTLFPRNMLQGKRVGVYEHSSVARDVIKDLLVHFGAEVVSLERTDTFVPIDTEAVSQEDVQKGLNWAKDYSLDAIVSTDGDGDRPLIANEKGEWLRGDILGVLCADYLQATHVAAPVNVNSVLELEGQKLQPARVSVRTKIGSPYVIEGMEKLAKSNKSSSIVGYEANGGFLVGSDILLNQQMLKTLPTRDSILPALIVFALSHEEGKPISCLSENFEARYTASDRIENIATKVSLAFIKSLKSDTAMQDSLLSHIDSNTRGLHINAIDEIDGLRIFLSNNDVVHFRASGNAPEIRVYIETNSAELAYKKLSVAYFWLKEVLSD
ncbi:phosphomannomutase [Marinomonas sp. TW1]|nr:phosphomannomutase [Marinomonas sp. TW1]